MHRSRIWNSNKPFYIYKITESNTVTLQVVPAYSIQWHPRLHNYPVKYSIEYLRALIPHLDTRLFSNLCTWKLQSSKQKVVTTVCFGFVTDAASLSSQWLKGHRHKCNDYFVRIKYFLYWMTVGNKKYASTWLPVHFPPIHFLF